VVGAKEDDNQRYKALLKYMEDRREERRERLQEDQARKERARKRHESFGLLKLSLDFLRQREDAWRSRRIDECERIKEEEKRDRIAVCKEKKRWYGMRKLSKEENKQIKMRTEERMDIARGKTNLWRKFGLGRDQGKIKDDELETWGEVKRLVIELEEEGEWRDKEINIRELTLRQPKLLRVGGPEGARSTCQGLARGKEGEEDTAKESKEAARDARETAKGVARSIKEIALPGGYQRDGGQSREQCWGHKGDGSCPGGRGASRCQECLPGG
jgi:hypothetical protein